MISVVYGVPLERGRCRCCSSNFTVRLNLCNECLDRFGRWRRIQIREEFDYSPYEAERAKYYNPYNGIEDDDPLWEDVKLSKLYNEYMKNSNEVNAREREALKREYADPKKEQDQLVDWLAWIIHKNPPWFHKFKVIHDREIYQ